MQLHKELGEMQRPTPEARRSRCPATIGRTAGLRKPHRPSVGATTRSLREAPVTLDFLREDQRKGQSENRSAMASTACAL